ncbi:hypothetical protein EI94DRAFT_1785394 [Lactarius quietus]|nr:hypothetical protein EI94DRAFT_1785394 [Lactarius quietus]
MSCKSHCAAAVFASTTEMNWSDRERMFLCNGTGTASSAVSQPLLMSEASNSHRQNKDDPAMERNAAAPSPDMPEAIDTIGNLTFGDLAEVLGVVKSDSRFPTLALTKAVVWEDWMGRQRMGVERAFSCCLSKLPLSDAGAKCNAGGGAGNVSRRQRLSWRPDAVRDAILGEGKGFLGQLCRPCWRYLEKGKCQ